METITEKDISRLVDRIAAHYPGQHLDYDRGQPSVGHAWRLNFMLDYPASHGLTSFPGLDRGYLGSSRREAYRTLEGILAGMEAQRLVQADSVRFARERLERPERFDDPGRKLDMLAADGLDELAPPTEF